MDTQPHEPSPVASLGVLQQEAGAEPPLEPRTLRHVDIPRDVLITLPKPAPHGHC